MADPVVLTIATERNEYVKEFEQSLENNGYEYKLLGLGQKWRGFEMKMELYKQELSNLGNRIVIVCDSYDIVFLENRKTILDKYHALANDKVVIGLENLKDSFCDFSTICIPEIIKKCNIINHNFLGFKYINSGFIMGRADQLMGIFQFMIDHKLKDDQYGLFKWILNDNCDKCYFDTDLNFVFNYFPDTFPIKYDEDIKLIDNGKVLVKNRTTGTEAKPSAVHIPAQYIDFGIRSEEIRNHLFPSRDKRSRAVYAKEFYSKLCKKEFNMFGYWWPILFLFVVLMIVMVVNACVNK